MGCFGGHGVVGGFSTANQRAANGLLVQSRSLVAMPKCWANDSHSQSDSGIRSKKDGACSLKSESNRCSVFSKFIPGLSRIRAILGNKGQSSLWPRNSTSSTSGKKSPSQAVKSEKDSTL